MCGIFGVMAGGHARYDPSFLTGALELLARHSKARGKDSSGLVFRRDDLDRFDVFKGAVPISFLMRSGQIRRYLRGAIGAYSAGEATALAVFGHSRLVTNGSQLSEENNQPVVKDGIIGIHNGIIVNDEDLWERNPDLRREYQIDTEVLLALIRKRIAAGHSLPGSLSAAAADSKGTIATALFLNDMPCLVLGTNNGSLYTLSNDQGLLFFASEQYPLTRLLSRLGPLPGTSDLRQLVGGTGLLLDLRDFSLQPFQLDQAGAEAAASRPVTSHRPYAVHVESVTDGRPQLELVLDVAMIARAPESSRRAKILEYNHEAIGRLRRCSRCILPETFPFIEFDGDGHCNYCRGYRLRNQPKPLDQLLSLLEPYRRTDGKPDCIVPFSGGRDSTFALHTIKTELGLNPIAYTYDWGMVTDLGRRNIARVCGKLGVENIIVAADIHWKRANIRKNIEAWLRRPHLGMIPLFMAGDKFFYYYVDQVKRQTGIALNIWGVNPLENTDFKVGFMGLPPDFGKKRIYSLSLGRQLKLFLGVAKAIAANPAYINGSVLDTVGSFISRSVMPHRDYFHLYDYFQWDEQRIDRLLIEEYEWERAVDTDTTWRIGDGTAAFYNYIYATVAGFSEHDTFRSNQIREGAISREEALRRVAEENRPRYATIKWYMDVVKVDFERAITTINAIPKLYPL